MKRYLFLAAAAFFALAAFVSGWFYIPAWLAVLFFVLVFHEQQTAPGKKMSPAIEALYATGVPALFTAVAWIPAVARLCDHPTWTNARKLILHPAVIVVILFYVVVWRGFRKGPDTSSGRSYSDGNEHHVP